MSYGSICFTYHQLKYSSPNRSTTKNQEPHKISYISENGGIGKNKSGEWTKSEKRSNRKNNRARQKNNRARQKNKRGDIEMWTHVCMPLSTRCTDLPQIHKAKSSTNKEETVPFNTYLTIIIVNFNAE